MSDPFAMFDGVRFAVELRRLQAQKRRIDNEWRPKMTAAREKRDWDEDGRLFAEWRMETDLIEDEIGQLQTNRLRETAQRLLIPMPKFDQDSGQWIESPITGKWRLSPQAIHDLRGAIRREQKERRDIWLPYVGVAAAVVSIIGAVISWWRPFS